MHIIRAFPLNRFGSFLIVIIIRSKMNGNSDIVKHNVLNYEQRYNNSNIAIIAQPRRV